MNSFIVLNNNVILIGRISEGKNSVKIQKPYMVVPEGNQVILIPYLRDILGQDVQEIDIQKSNILTTIQAENNTILQTYLKEISGIETGGEILLG